MPADVLILKKRGEKYTVKIRESMKGPPNCEVSVNMKNFKDVALFLADLKILWGCPIDKAIEEYKKNQNQDKKAPFW